MATSDPLAIVRWISSNVVTRMASAAAVERRRARAERRRRRTGAPHRIGYFHQADDGYGHLAAQLLRPLLRCYVVPTTKQMTTWLTKPVDDRHFPIVMIDGIILGDQTVLIALGIDAEGQSCGEIPAA